MRLSTRTSFAAIVVLSGLCLGCQKKQEPAASTGPAGAPITPEARQEAAEIFASRCAACHGATGAGDGAVSASLNPKPRNYRDAAWQASVTDQQIEKAILEGGPAIGKSPMMPPNPDLASKPAVLAALREHVRSFGKP